MTKKDDSQNMCELDPVVFEALRSAGLSFPETPAEVFDMMHRIGDGSRPEQILHVPQNEGVDDSLTRAAREGGTISKDIEERMQRDRRKAENSTDEQS